MKILIIDNYDSFTYNLAQLVYQATLTAPIIIRNDQVDYDSIVTMSIDGIIISAGPGRPEHFHDLGVAREIILQAPKPILGICLGMQAIVHYHGGTIQYAPEQMHGRTSTINHDAQGLFADIPQHFTAMRYHSLVADSNLPTDFKRTAWTNDNIVMAVQHKSKPLWGVQFHPESISTSYGHTLINNFIRYINVNFQTARAVKTSSQVTSAMSKKSIRVKKYHRWIDPAIVFEQLYASADNSFWLDSNSSEHHLSTVSYMGDSTSPHSHSVKYNNHGQLLVNDAFFSEQHIFDYLEQKIKQQRCDSPNNGLAFCGGFIGWFGYELENDSATPSRHMSEYPDAAFIFADRFLVFEIKQKIISLVTIPFVNNEPGNETEYSAWLNSTIAKLDTLFENPDISSRATQATSKTEPLTFKLAKSRKDYIDDINLAKEKIRQGESYELCLTNSLSTDISRSGFEIYKILRTNNPAPYSSYLKFTDIEVLSSSPERFLSIDQDRNVSSKPIKGTISRGTDPDADSRNKQFLQTNIKDSAENLMIVDLLRNDLSKVCQYGSVKVPTLLDVESFATVHQLVSTIEGTLANDISNIDCIRSCFPGGSMTGAPKIRSMNILADIEKQARGIYSGSLGYLSLNGCCDFSIVIRTIIINKHKASIGCGGAIVALSNAEQEYAEILLKAKSLIEAIVIAEKGDYNKNYYKVSE